MIVSFQTAYHKNTLLLQAYAKAQKLINYHSENPVNPRQKFFVELSEEMTFIDFVPSIISRFYDSVNREPFPEELIEIMSPIMDSVQESMYVETPHFFHFGLLLKNKELLETGEFLDFDRRITAMFEELSSVSCTSFMDFYNLYFRHNFYSNDGVDLDLYREELNYTYLFFCDYNMHSVDDYGAGFMKRYAIFARSYAEFYDDLTSLLEKKRRDSLVSI